MVSGRIPGVLAGVAAVVCSISATAHAQQQVSIKIDQWGEGGASLPYMTAHLTIDPSAPANVQSAFSGDNGANEYAGVFGGEQSTGQSWDVFCTDLDQNIYIGNTYTFNIYSNLLTAPIRTGVPANDTAPLISVDQKLLIQEVISHCLGLGTTSGMDPPGYQFLTGMYASAKWSLYNADTNPTGMTNQKAAAAQLLIWEIVHENWNYGTTGTGARGSVPLDQFDPAWVAANMANDVVDLKSGWLQWSYDNTTTDAFGYTVDDYFYGNTAKNPNMIGLKNCALNAYYQAVPEATTAVLGGMAVWPFLIARRRRALNA